MIAPAETTELEPRTLIDALLDEQRDLTAVERFAQWHESDGEPQIPSWRRLIPLTTPGPGEQYAFEVDLDRCSGCKSCVTACHALNGLDEGETWRSVGLLHQSRGHGSFQQTVTSACHHCVDPGCLSGCPVLAYDKDPVSGIVRHLDDQCIGCQYCVFMCSYDVPKYSASRGIVRKCDMCHQRLAYGEAPACVQACPSEAIRITTVVQDSVRELYRPAVIKPEKNLSPGVDARETSFGSSTSGGEPNAFLTGSPDPAITLPTTRYVSARPLPKGLLAGDSHETNLEPAHAPLVWMLVLTQLGAGGFAFLPATPMAARPTLSVIALAATWLGLAGSILHLGRPQKAWRCFLGLRHSWLSREIVAFGVFCLLALATTISAIAPVRLVWRDALFLATAAAGTFGVFCSGMTYHVTRRECWRGENSIGRFYGTSLVLGLAAAWFSTSFAGVKSVGFATALVLAVLAKLSREFATLRLCPDDADLNNEPPAASLPRSAFVMRFRLGLMLRTRFACAWLGGVILPLVSLLPVYSTPSLAMIGFALCLFGEFAERSMFFRAAVTQRMPGGVAT